MSKISLCIILIPSSPFSGEVLEEYRNKEGIVEFTKKQYKELLLKLV